MRSLLRNKYDFRWDVLDVIISGKSSIDSLHGFQIQSVDEADRFIQSYGYDLGDPIQAALRWQEAGAEWLHLVDLDAAFGHGNNRELQAKIVGAPMITPRARSSRENASAVAESMPNRALITT